MGSGAFASYLHKQLIANASLSHSAKHTSSNNHLNALNIFTNYNGCAKKNTFCVQLAGGDWLLSVGCR